MHVDEADALIPEASFAKPCSSLLQSIYNTLRFKYLASWPPKGRGR